MTTNDNNGSCPEISSMFNVNDKKSLGYLMVYLYDRWEEEKGEEEFDGYKNYLKKVLRKYTPKSTKLLEFKEEPFECKLYLQNINKNCCISVNQRKLDYTLT